MIKTNSTLCENRTDPFSAKDDNTVGDTVSTGNLTGYYASGALVFMSPPATISNFRISYAQDAIVLFYHNGAVCPVFNDGQLVNCQNGFYRVFMDSGNIATRNMLFANVQAGFNAVWNSTVDAQNTTFSGCGVLTTYLGYGGLSLENCILANVAARAYYIDPTAYLSGANNGFYHSTPFGTPIFTAPANPFQTAGGGHYYLADNTFRGKGTTAGISPSLLADLATKTTYPPIVYSDETISVDSTFDPRAWRDTSSSPDLGYHYDPIDYFFGGVTAQSSVTFTAGTAVGWFELPGSGGPGYGIALKNGIFATFNGTATSPCVFARYDTVQEGGNGLWKDKGWLGGIENGDSYDQNNPAVLTATFTHFSHLAGDPNHFRDGTGNQPIVVQAKNCEFYGGAVGYNILAGYTNCLFYRAGFGISNSLAYPYQKYINCTFYGGSLNFGHSEGGAPYWYSYIHDCAFDGTTFSIGDPFGSNTNYADYSYNAFNSGAAQPPTEGANTVTVTGGFNWQTNRFGNYYLPSNSSLIDAGDRTADRVGLYYFTTQTNQVPEGFSTVDIGYHYPVDNTDSDADGLPDWWEYYWFGNLGHSGSDLDSGGVNTLLADYQNYLNGVPSLDPNVIAFALSTTNDYVNTNFVAVQVSVMAGWPSHQAVLVNSTNFAGATWTSYTSSNLTVNLGSLNDGNYAVWVNGTKANYIGGMVWEATNVYLPTGGTALIQARAIPNTSNGGNGTGGSGGGPVTYDNLGNPDPPQDNDAESQVNKPAYLYTQSYAEGDGGYCGGVMTYGQIFHLDDYNWCTYNITNGGAGADRQHADEDNDDGQGGWWDAWFADQMSSPVSGVGTDINSSSTSEDDIWTTVSVPTEYGQWGWIPPVVWEHCGVQLPVNAAVNWPYQWSEAWETGAPQVIGQYHRTADAVVKLKTGGKATSQRRNLFCLSAAAAEVVDKFEYSYCWEYPQGNMHISGPVGTVPIPAQGITIGGLGNLRSDGTLWVALPDNQDIDVTPRVQNKDFYTFNVSQSKQCAPVKIDFSDGPSCNLRPYHVDFNLAVVCNKDWGTNDFTTITSITWGYSIDTNGVVNLHTPTGNGSPGDCGNIVVTSFTSTNDNGNPGAVIQAYYVGCCDDGDLNWVQTVTDDSNLPNGKTLPFNDPGPLPPYYLGPPGSGRPPNWNAGDEIENHTEDYPVDSGYPLTCPP
jgi:hypothetical protein